MKSNDQDDLQKWDRFKKGDDFVLSYIYSGNAELLYQYGLKFTVNRDLIEDTIQDLFLDLIRNRSTIGETDHIRFYLLKSFRRKLIRKLTAESKYVDDQFSEIMFGVRYSIEQDIILEETQNDTSKRLASAIEKLSPRQKEAIYLKFNKELDYNEISEVLGMGIEASRNLIYRAVKSLKNAILKAGNYSVLLFIFQKIKNSLKKNQFQ
ncbi:MAG: sigma-70 family RNA polymerase sigma factor [Peptostreptococcaceae bacterium]|nr:sigma-70 family RNA polymerase sigma factor [Peptostreptococcaceae bacterium]